MQYWRSSIVGDVAKKNFVALKLLFRWRALFRVLARLSLRSRARVPPQGVTPTGHEYHQSTHLALHPPIHPSVNPPSIHLSSYPPIRPPAHYAEIGRCYSHCSSHKSLSGHAEAARMTVRRVASMRTEKDHMRNQTRLRWAVAGLQTASVLAPINRNPEA